MHTFLRKWMCILRVLTVIGVLLDVTSANSISFFDASVVVTILAPIISDITIAVISDKSLLPSCVPDSGVGNVTTQRVFRGVVSEFEASVDVRFNVTFHWSFICDDDMTLFDVLQSGNMCDEGQSCTISLQNFVFNSTGHCSVQVTAFSSYNEVSESLELVVISPEVLNVTLSLQDPGMTVSPLGQTTSLILSLMTTMVQTMSISADFGDGTKRQIEFRYEDGEGNATAPHEIPQNPDESDMSTTTTNPISTTTTSFTTMTMTTTSEFTTTTTGLAMSVTTTTNSAFTTATASLVATTTTTMTTTGPVATTTMTTTGPVATTTMTMTTTSPAATTTTTTTTPYGTSSYSNTVELIGIYSYTQGCQLTLELRHVYLSEGTYRPTVTVDDTQGNVTLPLNVTVTVEKLLNSVALNHSDVEAVDAVVTFVATTDVASIFTMFLWQITVLNDDGLTMSIFDNVTNDSALNYSFAQAGSYVVTVTAYNDLSSVGVDSTIAIQRPVATITMSCDSRDFVLVDENVNCSVAVDGGTNVTFEWNFGDDVFGWTSANQPTNLSSLAVHRYLTVGTYAVSVVAYNAFNRLSALSRHNFTVLEPVSGLSTAPPQPTLFGNDITFVVAVRTGSDVVFVLDFGDLTSKFTTALKPGVNVSVSHLYVIPGSYSARFSASNEASNVTKIYDVDILKNVSDVRLSFVGPLPLVVGRNTTLAVYIEGQLSNRTDVVYNWSVDGVIFAITQSPVANFTFNATGSYNVSVVVYNLISLQFVSSVFDVIRDLTDLIRFDQNVDTAGDPALFTLVNLPFGELEFEVNYGDDESYENNFHLSATEHRLSHKYFNYGLYEVTVRCCTMLNMSEPSNNSLVIVKTLVSVQQRLTDMVIKGSEVLPVSRSNEDDMWKAMISSGTNVIFVWKCDKSVLTYSAKNTVAMAFPIGQHVVSVTAVNGVGSINVNMSVLLQYPITYVSIVATPVSVGHVTGFFVTVDGDQDFVLTYNYGDRTIATISSVSVETVSVGGRAGSPTYLIASNHTYRRVGEYNVALNVSNRVSWLKTNATTTVYQSIGDVVLSTDSPILVPSSAVVTLAASVTADYNLTFDWQSSRGTCQPLTVDRAVEANGWLWSSNANCSMSPVAGINDVFVNVSNPVTNDWKIKNITFIGLDLVDGLTISTQTGSTAIVLKQNSTSAGSFYTDPVKFTVHVTKGSDLMCTFDFGDNSSNVTISHSVKSPNRCQAMNVYRKSGSYQVVVTAFNELSSQSQSMTLYIEEQPVGLYLKRDMDPFRTRIMQNITFTADITAGTNVLYNWTMGDGQFSYATGPVVVGRYASNGCFFLTVVVYNKVGNDSVSATVVVQDSIQSVQIGINEARSNATVTPTGIIVETGQMVVFVASYLPNFKCLVDGYDWRPLNSSQSPYSTIVPQYPYAYRKPGTFLATVNGYNLLSNQTSQPLIVQAMDRLQPVQIIIVGGESVINQEIVFDAYHFMGTSVNYSWFFDNNTTMISLISTIKHTFTRVGVYDVIVYAVNAISNEAATKKIFIVEKYCKPPVISLLGPMDAVYLRSADVRIEADIAINCSLTNVTLYTWTVFNATSGATYRTFDIHDPVLYLQRQSLPYGNYSVQLQVAMNDTIVFGLAIELYNFSISTSALVAVIRGGIMRNVSYNQLIVLNGKNSYDPDFPGSNDLNFSWSCFHYHAQDRSCFSDDNTTNEVRLFNGNVLSIDGSKFARSSAEYLFKLNVSKPNRNSSLYLQKLVFEEDAIDIFISCNECDDQLINSNDRLMFVVDHSGFSEDDLTYVWNIYDVIGAGSADPAAVNLPVPGECLYFYGSINSFRDNNSSLNNSGSQDEVTNPPAAANDKLADVETMPASSPPPSSSGYEYMLTTRASSVTDVGASKTSTMSGVGSAHAPAAPGSLLPHADEVSLGGRKKANPRFPFNPEEADSMAGRPLSPPSGSQAKSQPTEDLDSAVDQQRIFREKEAQLTAPRNERILRPDETPTGVNQRQLVVGPYVFTQGLQYLVQITVRHRVLNLTGTSLMTFKVNESPSLGQCIVSVDPENAVNGTEMQTQWGVYCREWKDKDNNVPIQYEVSYSRSPSESLQLVYQGLNNMIKFQLPAGDPSNFYSVHIEVAVFDGLGAKTVVCLNVFNVLPSAVNDEETLYVMVGGNSTLAMYVGKGDNRNARLFSLMIASRLNRLSNAINETNLFLRKDIRASLLTYVQGLPLRDFCELQQTVTVMAAVTQITQEINEICLTNASEILNNVNITIYELLWRRLSDDYGIIESAIEGASYLISVVTTIDVGPTRKQLVMKMINITENLLQMQTRQSYEGESPVNLSTDAMSTFVGVYHLDGRAASQVINLDGGVVCSLPPQPQICQAAEQTATMTNSSGINAPHHDSNSDCYSANAILYKKNPFVYGTQTKEINTDILSVNLFTCDGLKMAINNLGADDQIKITLPNQLQTGNRTVYELNRQFMNIHSFNLMSSDVLNNNLHIDLQFIPISPSVHLFPISILLQVDVEPSPTSYMFKWDLPMNSLTTSLVVQLQDYINKDGLSQRQFFLAVVDQTFNAGRPRPNQASRRNYYLSIWWGQCLYWNQEQDDWENGGCYIDNSSSYYQAVCRCSHLTSFAASLSFYPTLLLLIDVDTFFSLPLNPVTCAFIASMFIIYAIVMVIAVKLDNHDNRKLPVVSLVDNSTNDRQKYYVTLETGFRKRAGTSAKVSFVLHGEYGMSETRELISQTGQPLFERNSRDTFYMTFPESLGSIFKVQLWHDNSGPSPSWYLSRVIVRDACTDDVYYFVCEKWFAVEKEDGKVEREIMNTEKGLGFTKVLTAKSMQYLTDHHIWFSTIVKPSYSRFTRAQRLTCCLCLLTTFMAISTAWYQYVGPPYRGEFSLIDISYQSIVIGMVIGVMALPPTYVIIPIFRRSKVFRNDFEETNENKDGRKEMRRSSQQAGEGATEGGGGIGGGGGEEQISGFSIFDQTVLSWQSLQEWAQRVWAKRYQHSSIGSSTQSFKPITMQNAPTEDQCPATDDNGDPVALTQVQLAIGADTKKETGETRLSDKNVKTKNVEPLYGLTIESVEPVDMIDTKIVQPTRAKTKRSLESVAVEEMRNTSDNENNRTAPRHSSSSPQENGGEEEVGGGGGGRKGEGGGEKKDAKSMKSKNKTSSKVNSNASSPASSFFDSSPKEMRRHSPSTASPPSSSSAGAVGAIQQQQQPPSYGISQRPDGQLSHQSSSSSSRSNHSSIKSGYLGSSNSSVKKSNKKKWSRLFFPHSFVYIGWILSFLLISGCCAVTIYFGHRFSLSQSIFWLQSVFFSFLQCIFISHPFIVTVMMFYSGIRYRNDMSLFDHYDDGLIHEKVSADKASHEKQTPAKSFEGKTLTLAQGVAARQRSRYLRFARPPQEQRLIEARHQTMKEANASALVNESILFVGQFLLLVFIAFGTDTSTVFQLKTSLTDAFIDASDLPYNHLHDLSEWWTWINGPFLDAVYDDEGYSDNYFMIGAIQLRQLRIVDEVCPISSSATAKWTCYHLYDSSVHDTNVFFKNGTPYYYEDADMTGATPIYGKFGVYDAGGFLVILDSTSRNATAKQLNQLRSVEWIDRNTSAVVVQFTLFHPESNLFTTVTLLLEIPPLGEVFPSYRLSVVYLYKYITTMDNMVLACEMLFFLATMLKIHHEIIQVLRHGLEYLKNIWNVLEVSQCLLSLALIICYTYRFLLIDYIVEKMRSTFMEEFVDISNLAYWDQVMRSLTGFVLLLINLQLVKGLRHHQPFSRFTNVYSHTALDFVVFGCMFVIWLGAYVSLGIAVFAGQLRQMRSVSQSVSYMSGVLSRSYTNPDVSKLSADEMRVWEFYCYSFLYLAHTVTTGYLLAFLTFYYKVFKDEPVLVFSPRENAHYYWHKLLDIFFSKSSSASDDRSKQPEIIMPPEFTMAEIQYQVDEMLFKMNALAGTSNLPEKPIMYFTDSDTTYGGGGAGEEASSNSEIPEEKFEGFLQKMKENLFRNDPHFAPLINPDSQGARKDSDKQLRLQLEVEIMRHLQNKRSSDNNRLSDLSMTNQSSSSSTCQGTCSQGTCLQSTCCQGRDPRSTAATCRQSAAMKLTPWIQQFKIPKSVNYLGMLLGANDGTTAGDQSCRLATAESDSNLTGLNGTEPVQPSTNVELIASIEMEVLRLMSCGGGDKEDEDTETEFGAKSSTDDNNGRGKARSGRWIGSGSSLHPVISSSSPSSILSNKMRSSSEMQLTSSCSTEHENENDDDNDEETGFENEGYVVESSNEEEEDEDRL